MVARSDELEAYGEPGVVQPRWKGCGRLLRQVERESKGRPIDPTAEPIGLILSNGERCNGYGRSDQQIKACMEIGHFCRQIEPSLFGILEFCERDLLTPDRTFKKTGIQQFFLGPAHASNQTCCSSEPECCEYLYRIGKSRVDLNNLCAQASKLFNSCVGDAQYVRHHIGVAQSTAVSDPILVPTRDSASPETSAL